MYERDFNSWLRYLADMRHCRDMLRHGSRSFYAASLVLPATYRSPITALYAFCRMADDEIDRRGADLGALAGLHRRLDRIYAGQPERDSVDRAFADVVRVYRIPRPVPAALLEGFAWDIERRDYETLSELYAYAARVAGTVGTMMAIIMGARRPGVLSRACDLGVAMQLTNIARDVGEDARAGRLYLPRELLRAEGIDPDAWLADPVMNDGIAAVVATLLCAADRLYRRSEWGISTLPVSCRPAMFAARSIYAEIGREIERRGYDSVSSRAVVDGRRKGILLGRAMKNAIASLEKDDAPPLSETRFLIDAVGQA